MEPGVRDVGVRAAVHALDAALAEHRRAIALEAGARERERMARARVVKAAAAAGEAALEQRVDRPMRGLKVAETWIEVDRVMHRLTAAVRAELDGTDLRVFGDGWSARLVPAPGDGPAEAARAAAVRVGEAARGAHDAAVARLALVAATARAEGEAEYAAAAALAAADRRIAERHAERARADTCLSALTARLGPLRRDEPPEVEAARSRIAPARAHLDAEIEQPYAWIAEWPPEIAGAILRDLPEERREAAAPALRRLAAALAPGEVALALGAAGENVAAVIAAGGAATASAGAGAQTGWAGAGAQTRSAGSGARVAGTGSVRVLVAAPAGVSEHAPGAPAGLGERRPGRMAAIAELARAARAS